MITIRLPNGKYQYDPDRSLGRRGGFGQTFAGVGSDGTQLAVKKLHLSAADAAHRELAIATELKSRDLRNVISVIDSGDYRGITSLSWHAPSAAYKNGLTKMVRKMPTLP